MRWKTTALLALIFAGLGTFYYVYEIRQGPARQEAAARQGRLWKDLDAAQVDTLTLMRPGETVRLERSDGDWRLAAPIEARADQQAAEGLVAQLATLRVEREVDPQPAIPAEFGLEPAAVEVTLTVQGRTHGLRLGARNPTGTWVYAQEAGRSAVFLISDGLLREAQKPVRDLRDRTLLAFDRQAVRALEITPREGPALTTAREGDAWRLTAPTPVRADSQVITAVLDKLWEGKITDFVAETARTPAAYGLTRPLVVTVVTGQGEARARHTLELGSTARGGAGVYARRAGEAPVFLVEGSLAEVIPTSVAALRDRTVLAFDRAKVERLEVERAKGTVVLAREEDRWRITAPADLPADASAVNDLLWKVRELRARKFVAEGAAARARYGLDRPAVRLALWETGARAPRTLRLAPTTEKDAAYAAADEDGPVVLVGSDTLAALGRTVRDFRDRTLFPGLDVSTVARVRIERARGALELAREGTDDWALVVPERGRAQGSRVSELLWGLRGLKWRELVAERDWDPAGYGLDQTGTTVTLLDRTGTVLAGLAIGRREGAETYVRVPGRPELYRVDTTSLGDVPASAEDVVR